VSETSTPPPQPAHTRWHFIRDVLVLQVKLILGNIHNFFLIPVTLAAAAIDLVVKTDRHGGLFYRALDWGRRAEEAIGLYSALDRDDEGLKHDFTVDAVIKRLEGVIVREYEKGGTAASMKTAIDTALDQLHSETGKTAAKAQEAAQAVIKKLAPPETPHPNPPHKGEGT
jgi:ribosome-associated translation inhibitor RaiA